MQTIIACKSSKHLRSARPQTRDFKKGFDTEEEEEEQNSQTEGGKLNDE